MNTHTAEQVQSLLQKLPQYLPEFTLLGGLLLLVVIDLILKKSNKNRLTILGVVALVVLLITSVMLLSTIQKVGLSTSVLVKLILSGGTVLNTVLMMNEDRLEKIGEHFTLMLGILLGAFFLINSDGLLTFHLSLEVMSISAYALTALSRTRDSAEASLKYLLFGATSSAIMLFGISLIYGFSGAILWQDIYVNAMIVNVGQVPTLVGFGMLLIGLLFKIAAAPMYIWAPDVYQSTRTSVVAFFSIVPKLAGVFMLFVILSSLEGEWLQSALIIVAVASMVVGNTAAIWQKDAKRMLAYSSIAHTGFLLIPVIVGGDNAFNNLAFYAVIYLLMNVAAFGLVLILKRRVDATDISKYKGLGMKWPLLGILVVVVMIALTGLPPTAGFTAKLFIFTSLWEAYSASGDSMLITLLVAGVLNTVISLFYYLKVPYFMFIKPAESNVEDLKTKLPILNYLMIILVVILLMLFFKPDWLMEIINTVNFAA